MSYNSKFTGEELERRLDLIPELEKMIGTHNKEVRFFCIEPVVVKVGEVEHNCEANQVATVFVGDEEFEIIPTSNRSIQSLLGYPIPLKWFDWLEGVEVFDSIVFDMNELDTYKHWIQYYQGDYHVQKAQYTNCVFWSDKPYTHSPFEERTNYTMYYSAQLPLCYSRIPENTYKPFYLAYGVNTDPNWRNPDYINSYSNVSGATQTFSYYGATAIGIFDMGVDIITLPKDCRGLMYHAPAITHAGVFDAAKTTNFGAKKGSWQEAFGDCISLTSLYIKNLKKDINISWSPINVDSMEFIINNAANTTKLTISVSPYTYYRLPESLKTTAASKNIVISLLEGNYFEDNRWKTKQDVISDLVAIRDGAAKGATAIQEHQQLKTINGESIVGSGNITIQGGSGGSSGGSGIAIVDDVSKLDPNAALGTLASVVEPGSIKETLISELPQPDSSIINMDTGFIDATSCPQVSGLSIIIPDGPIPVSMKLTEGEMLYFCSESVDLASNTTGIVLGILPQIVNNEIIALAGMYMNIPAREQKQWAFFIIQNGVVSVDQAAIDECNAYIKDLHYIGAMEYVTQGLSLTTEQLIIYDNVVKAVAGIPSKAHVYLKKDNWEELYAKDFAKLASNIGKIETSVNAKADKMPIESYSSYGGLKPNIYTTYTISSTGSVTIKLADIVDSSTYNEYIIEIQCTSTPSKVVFKDSNNTEVVIKWANGIPPTFESGITYLISIANGFGVYSMFPNS